VAAFAALFSLALCVAWWTDAIVGAVIDGVILVGLLISTWITRAKGA
jgi:hypothetical protein